MFFFHIFASFYARPLLKPRHSICIFFHVDDASDANQWILLWSKNALWRSKRDVGSFASAWISNNNYQTHFPLHSLFAPLLTRFSHFPSKLRRNLSRKNHKFDLIWQELRWVWPSAVSSDPAAVGCLALQIQREGEGIYGIIRRDRATLAVAFGPRCVDEERTTATGVSFSLAPRAG